MISKSRTETACKVTKMLLPNNRISPYSVSLRIQSECGEIRTRKKSVFGHFSRSVAFTISAPLFNKNKLTREISYCHKALIILHDDFLNSHVPDFNLLEFLVNGLQQSAKTSKTAY